MGFHINKLQKMFGNTPVSLSSQAKILQNKETQKALIWTGIIVLTGISIAIGILAERKILAKRRDKNYTFLANKEKDNDTETTSLDKYLNENEGL